jgi:hypothetical protein
MARCLEGEFLFLLHVYRRLGRSSRDNGEKKYQPGMFAHENFGTANYFAARTWNISSVSNSSSATGVNA